MTITAPEVLSFRRTFQATVGFLDGFRDATLGSRRWRQTVYVDLIPIREISVPVAIVLAAEFHRWSIVHRIRLRIRNYEKWAPQVRMLFYDLGVFELLDMRVAAEPVTDTNLTLSRLQSGVRLDGKKIDFLQSTFQAIVKGLTKNPSLYDGLSEAAENAIAHAYPDGYSPRHQFAGYRWWAASCLDPQAMRLRFFVFDQGAGIPYTLPTNDLYEAIRAWAAGLFGDLFPNDAMMLRAAMEIGRTRTGVSHRGLGLKKMADVIENEDGGYLRILSGKGEIQCHPDGRIDTWNHDRSIGGTLIEWSVPASALTDGSESKDADDQHR